MADKALDSFPIGAGKLVPVDHTGPASYTTGGETLGTINNMTGMALNAAGLSTIDAVEGSGSLSVSGSYWVMTQPTGSGSRKTFKLLWFTATAGVPSLTQVAAAVNLSAETVRLAYIGR
jgi:hypothetical protein